jgi:hypothetical protein
MVQVQIERDRLVEAEILGMDRIALRMHEPKATIFPFWRQMKKPTLSPIRWPRPQKYAYHIKPSSRRGNSLFYRQANP